MFHMVSPTVWPHGLPHDGSPHFASTWEVEIYVTPENREDSTHPLKGTAIKLGSWLTTNAHQGLMTVIHLLVNPLYIIINPYQ